MRSVIRSFKDKDIEKLLAGKFVRKFQGIEKAALKKLDEIDSADDITDLLTPPSNQLKILSGKRKGQYAIRINRQWRICFYWNGGAEGVEITDYH